MIVTQESARPRIATEITEDTAQPSRNQKHHVKEITTDGRADTRIIAAASVGRANEKPRIDT